MTTKEMAWIKNGLLIAVCVLSTTFAYAQDRPQHGGGMQQHLKEMDKDGDKKISKKEATGCLAEDFSKFDKDSDGFITAAELKSMAPNRGKNQGRNKGRLMKMLDKDGDKRISKKEAKGKIAELFNQIDKDKDGYLDVKEMQSMRRKSQR